MSEQVIDRSVSQVPEETGLSHRPAGALASPMPTGGVPTMNALLQQALTSNLSAESMEKIVGLCERMADREAAKEASAALAEFQSDCPAIKKNSTAKIPTKSGSSYTIKYADLDSIVRIVRPLLKSHGFSFTWDSTEEKGAVTSTCILRHVNGHTLRASFTCSTETSAAMSGPQRSAAAVTYARRQSLVQVLGLTTCDPDTDAALQGTGEKITESQAADLKVLMDEVKADAVRFLKVYGVTKLADLPAVCLKPAVKMLEERRGKA